MNTFILNIAKLTVEVSPHVFGCAISPKHIIAPKETLARSRSGGPYVPRAVHDYVTDHKIEGSPFTIVESALDLKHELGVSDDQFPKFSDVPPALGEMLAVAKAGYLTHPEPRLDMWHGKTNHSLDGTFFLATPCSYMLHAANGSVHMLVSTPKTTLPSGTPVFDTSGRLRGLIFLGFDNCRIAAVGVDREESAIFEVLPILKQDIGSILALKSG